jgi:hypothetical protein
MFSTLFIFVLNELYIYRDNKKHTDYILEKLNNKCPWISFNNIIQCLQGIKLSGQYEKITSFHQSCVHRYNEMLMRLGTNWLKNSVTIYLNFIYIFIYIYTCICIYIYRNFNILVFLFTSLSFTKKYSQLSRRILDILEDVCNFWHLQISHQHRSKTKSAML